MCLALNIQLFSYLLDRPMGYFVSFLVIDLIKMIILMYYLYLFPYFLFFHDLIFLRMNFSTLENKWVNCPTSHILLHIDSSGTGLSSTPPHLYASYTH